MCENTNQIVALHSIRNESCTNVNKIYGSLSLSFSLSNPFNMVIASYALYLVLRRLSQSPKNPIVRNATLIAIKIIESLSAERLTML